MPSFPTRSWSTSSKSSLPTKSSSCQRERVGKNGVNDCEITSTAQFGSKKWSVPHPGRHQGNAGLGLGPLSLVVRWQRRGDVVWRGFGVSPFIFVIEEGCWYKINHSDTVVRTITCRTNIHLFRKQTRIITENSDKFVWTCNGVGDGPTRVSCNAGVRGRGIGSLLRDLGRLRLLLIG